MVLRFGTDCTGIDAARVALDNLGVTYDYRFASEIEPKLLTFLASTQSPPQTIYADITQRPTRCVAEPKDHPTNSDRGNPDDALYVDLYVAGFPCQSFSTSGKRRGLADKRGMIVHHVLSYIETYQPKMFVLENVKGFATIDNGKTLEDLLVTLRNIKPINYVVDYKIISPHELGFPQRRPRLFIVGSSVQHTISWPRRHQDCDFMSLIDNSPSGLARPISKSRQQAISNAHAAAVERGIDMINNPYAIDLSFCRTQDKQQLGQPNLLPCLHTRGDQIYFTQQRRLLTTKEAFRFQGFSDDFHDQFADHSRCFKFKVAGNSMCVPVIQGILQCLLATEIM